MHDAVTYHQRFTPQQLEAQYNLRVVRPDFEVTAIPDWIKRSDSARLMLDGTLNIRYAQGDRQLLDVFTCTSASAPTLVYFHGGYWQRGDKSIYSFLALPYIQSQVNVVVVGYDLCPAVTITGIAEQARQAMAYLWRNASLLGINGQRLIVMGHSAGGHITQMMLGTDWAAYADDLPQDMICAGIPISPLSLLEPVRLTAGLNAQIRMDAAEAESQSPVLNHPPLGRSSILIAVGSAETSEFHRQAQLYQDACKHADREVSLYFVPEADHFDILDVLADPLSPFFKKTMALLDTT